MKRKTTITYGANVTYFLTTTVPGFAHVFQKHPLAQIFLNNLKFYCQQFNYKLHSFVIMPNHVHLLLTTGNKGNISQFMGRLKEYSAKQIIQWCMTHREIDLLNTFQASAEKYMPHHDYQVWQERFDDLCITKDETFEVKFHYIHNNLLQEHWKLAVNPEDYQYSSALYYEDGSNVGVDITPFSDLM